MQQILFNEPHWVYDEPNGKRINVVKENSCTPVWSINDTWVAHKFGWSKLSNDSKIIDKDTEDQAKTPIILPTQFDNIAGNPWISPSDQKKIESEQNKQKKNGKTGDTSTEEESSDDSDKSDVDFWSPFTAQNDSDRTIGTLLKNMNGIFGLPYQYLSNVDRRLPGTNYGRLYGEKIIARMPLLLMSPGKVNFMAGYSDKVKADFATAMAMQDKGPLSQIMNGGGDGALYEFAYDQQHYFEYVNSMCAMLAVFLNIQDIEMNGTKLGTAQWNKELNPQISQISGATLATSVAFYVDAETQVSQSYGNSTAESQLQSMTDDVSSTVQQVLYLVGGVGGEKVSKAVSDGASKVSSILQGFTSKFSSILPSKAIDFLDSSVNMILAGGKMALPELWQNASVNNSYDISIKLRTPDNDNVSWFLNIGVPLMHLLAFVLPMQDKKSSNVYHAPFLVRGYYKSIFHVQMGLITSMNISKGDKGRWTINGLPTEVNVQFSIKDLYDYLNISLYGKGTDSFFGLADMYKNSTLTDYIAVLAGININKPDLMRTIELYEWSFKNGGKSLITLNNTWLGLKDQINNKLYNMFRGTL